MTTDFTEEKQLASGWFRSLRDQIVAAFEELEETH
ncbi:MAG: coproporphyrinogen III oxidase, partial [Paracoccaceae bacterium]